MVWSWSYALLGVIYALPAAAVVLVDPQLGLALAVGVLPAAASGLPGPRRGRVAIALLGVLMGACLLVGSLLAQVPALAVPAIFALCVGAAAVASRGRAGQIALVLAVPLIGLGLSYDDLRETVVVALLMVVGSAYACLVSLLWPARPASEPAPEPRGPDPVGRRAMLGYGVRLGLAGATAAAIGFLLHLDHVGWVCGAGRRATVFCTPIATAATRAAIVTVHAEQSSSRRPASPVARVRAAGSSAPTGRPTSSTRSRITSSAQMCRPGRRSRSTPRGCARARPTRRR